MKLMKSLIKQSKLLRITLAVFISAVAIATPTLAYYLITTDSGVSNDFTPAPPNNPSIFGGAQDGSEIMKDVYVRVEDKDYPVYVRAMIVIKWKSNSGAVHYIDPIKGTDYRIDLNIDSSESETEQSEIQWKTYEIDEKEDTYFYYFPEVVKSGGRTSVLIKECVQLDSANVPAGNFSLNVEIIVQTIQAIGDTDKENGEIPAWQDAWGLETGYFKN